MGVERSVTRWYIQRHIILKEIELLETKLASAPANDQRSSSESEKEAADAPLQLARAREKLIALGPCPKSMMG